MTCNRQVLRWRDAATELKAPAMLFSANSGNMVAFYPRKVVIPTLREFFVGKSTTHPANPLARAYPMTSYSRVLLL
jgi:hypothetical protein